MRPYIPKDRSMTDEEAASLSEWFAQSQRYSRIKGIAALLVCLVMLSLAALGPSTPKRSTPDINKTPDELLAEINKSDEEHATALQSLRISLASKKQLEDLATLQSRYEQLKALTTGQEEIARVHRAILTERSWRDRLADCLFGVFASLAAAFVWERVMRSKALKRDNVESAQL